ncbi:VanZ family protein [Cohnella soli]|uniref:VanZ family protein n=1 Tax=Cohnella soli TaxID=425005 RepID=A0ABW0HUD8_9BACL
MSMGTMETSGVETNHPSINRLRALSLRALLFVYVYILVKIILLKFHAVDLGFLWKRLSAGLHQPALISQRLEAGSLVPFREISRSLQSFSEHDMYNLVGNVAIFMPFGVLLGLLFARKRLAGIKVLLCTSFLSLCLETSQLLFMIGQFDVDDLLLNTMGGILGFAIYRGINRRN